VHYRFAVEKGARFVPTSDGRAFVLIWMPPGSDPATTPILATLHGHDAWAFDEYSVWYNVASAQGVGIVALQWWFGTGDGPGDYYAPNELNREFTRALQALGTPPGMAVLQGFSRGAANVYGVAAYDRNGGSRYFALTVAVAGKASPDFPVNRDLVAGKFGSAPFAGSHWGMYCGEKDPTPDRDGCPGMREAERFVTGLGGSVDLFIDDPLGDHGGFSKTTSNQTRVLDLFAQLLAQKAQ
jgi:hypothetical protein